MVASRCLNARSGGISSRRSRSQLGVGAIETDAVRGTDDEACEGGSRSKESTWGFDVRELRTPRLSTALLLRAQDDAHGYRRAAQMASGFWTASMRERAVAPRGRVVAGCSCDGV